MEKKQRQYRSNQGRSPKQQTKNNKMLGWSLLGLVITIIFIFITKK
jgi:hypothetical protein